MQSAHLATLTESAQDWMRRALEAHLADDQRILLLNAAVALEHLSKAFLCSLHPALLADLSNKRDFDSLLHLCGLAQQAKPGHRLRTVGGAEAIERARRIFPSMSASMSQLNALMEIRNGAVHAGSIPGPETGDLLAAFIRVASTLIDEMNLNRRKFLGGYEDLVNRLISESLSTAERESHRRVAAHRQAFQQFLSQVPRSQRKRLIEAREKDADYSHETGEDVEHIKCPSCHQYGFCIGRRIRDNTRPGDVRFYPDRIRCAVCFLKLDGPEQVKAAGLAESWPVSPNLFEIHDIDL